MGATAEAVLMPWKILCTVVVVMTAILGSLAGAAAVVPSTLGCLHARRLIHDRDTQMTAARAEDGKLLSIATGIEIHPHQDDVSVIPIGIGRLRPGSITLVPS